MTARPIFSAALVLASLGLAGCWPQLMTARPKASITVTDADGAPIEGVRINLGTYCCFARPPDLTDFYTDRDGRLRIKRDLKWVIQVPLPDAMIYYGWDLCVSKPGYKAQYLSSLDFKKPIDIRLEPSTVPSECHRTSLQASQVVDWAPGVWILVDGGAWDPSGPNPPPFAQELKAHAELHARSLGHELRPWNEYLFQYQGRMTNTTRYVYISATCDIPKDVNLRTEFYAGHEGGSCHFEATYDVVRGRFDSFELRAAAAN